MDYSTFTVVTAAFDCFEDIEQNFEQLLFTYQHWDSKIVSAWLYFVNFTYHMGMVTIRLFFNHDKLLLVSIIKRIRGKCFEIKIVRILI